MGGGITIILHAVLLLLLIIELGLTGYLVSSNGLLSEATTNFMLFNTIWSLLMLLYLAIVPRVFARIYHSMVALGILCLTTLFWFAGSIALGAKTPIHCHGFNVCQVSQAATAFGFFIWAIFTALTVFEGLGARGGGRPDKPFSSA